MVRLQWLFEDWGIWAVHLVMVVRGIEVGLGGRRWKEREGLLLRYGLMVVPHEDAHQSS